MSRLMCEVLACLLDCANQHRVSICPTEQYRESKPTHTNKSSPFVRFVIIVASIEYYARACSARASPSVTIGTET